MKHISPGSWIQEENGSLKPNLNDPAMAERFKLETGNPKPETISEAGGQSDGTLNQ